MAKHILNYVYDSIKNDSSLSASEKDELLTEFKEYVESHSEEESHTNTIKLLSASCGALIIGFFMAKTGMFTLDLKNIVTCVILSLLSGFICLLVFSLLGNRRLFPDYKILRFLAFLVPSIAVIFLLNFSTGA
ncbi:hypothetical protein [Intestinibacillus massiliensis]|uniref:hypothetical protein n=1 Tax=Intestinibacillus massiliensis TaxID=1871029 RepID=UPI00117B6F4D|nr:hypothetical protein [Intestinibacillus massiliensis]